MPMNPPFSPLAHTPAAGPSRDYLPTSGETPDSPEEAAKAFEKILVRRFVKTMTDKMFDSPLSGNDGPSWMKSQRNHQRDVLTDVLADHIVESGTLGISDMLLRDLGMQSERDAPEPDSAPAQPPPSSASASVEPLPARPTRIDLSLSSTRR